MQMLNRTHLLDISLSTRDTYAWEDAILCVLYIHYTYIYLSIYLQAFISTTSYLLYTATVTVICRFQSEDYANKHKWI